MIWPALRRDIARQADNTRATHPKMCPTGKSPIYLSSPICKNISFPACDSNRSYARSRTVGHAATTRDAAAPATWAAHPKWSKSCPRAALGGRLLAYKSGARAFALDRRGRSTFGSRSARANGIDAGSCGVMAADAFLCRNKSRPYGLSQTKVGRLP
jgi:hypothetical protein